MKTIEMKAAKVTKEKRNFDEIYQGRSKQTPKVFEKMTNSVMI